MLSEFGQERSSRIFADVVKAISTLAKEGQ
jgi:hypothetical protein